MKEYIVKEIGKKKNMFLVKVNDESYLLSANSFSELLLYPNKKLSISEFAQLKQLSSFGGVLEECIDKLSRHPSSEFEIYQYLKNKKYEDKAIGQIIRKLKEYRLVDDENYAKEFQEQYSNYLGYGKNKVINGLKKKGVKEEIIDALVFPKEEEIENGKAYLGKVERQLSRLPNNAKKRKAESLLLAHGFEKEVISELLPSLSGNDDKTESDLLEKEYQLSLKSYQRRYQGRELKRHIISHLLYKGYNLDEIKKKVETIYDDD